MKQPKSCLNCDYFHEEVDDNGVEIRYCSSQSLGTIHPITIPPKLLESYFCYYYSSDALHKDVKPLYEKS